MIKHSNIEKSLHRFISEKLEVPYDYVINYGAVGFDTDLYDLWLSIRIDDIGAGAKKPSVFSIDIMSRIVGVAFNDEETIAIDRIRETFTNVSITLYDFVQAIPVIIPNERILVKNNDGRFTVDKVLLNNLQVDDLKNNLNRSSIILRIELLTDTVGGRTV